MSDYYYIGTAKIVGSDRMILIKADHGYLTVGNMVEVNTGTLHAMAEVVCTSLVSEGSADEAIMTVIAPPYEVNRIFVKNWEKKEEETEDGN